MFSYNYLTSITSLNGGLKGLKSKALQIMQ